MAKRMQPKAVHGLLAHVLRLLCASCVVLSVQSCGSGAQSSVDDVRDDPVGGGGAGGENEGGEGGGDFAAMGGATQAGGSASGGQASGGKPGVDGGTPSGVDGGTGELQVPPGLVPVVVALGPGGRTAVSCNGGRQFRVNDFHKTPDDDHSPYAVTGLAGGLGAVIASAGWGAPGRVLYSENAVDWQELPASQFTKSNGSMGPSTDSMSAAFFDGTAFKVFWSKKVWSSPQGKSWNETAFEPSNISHIRDTVFYQDANLLLVRVERDENGGRNFLMMTSTDLGQTYKVWSPRTTGCPGFEWGPVAYSHGVILAGGAGGAVCRSEDGGAKWTTVPALSGVNGMFADRSAFYVSRGDELLRSEDGVTFARVLKANGGLSVGVWSSQTGYVVTANSNGLKFYRSDDGKAWTPSGALLGTSFGVRFIRVAFVKPSPLCPGI